MVKNLPFPLQFTDDLGHHGILIIRDLEDVVQLVESDSTTLHPCCRWCFRCRGIEGDVGETLEGVVGELGDPSQGIGHSDEVAVAVVGELGGGGHALFAQRGGGDQIVGVIGELHTIAEHLL